MSPIHHAILALLFLVVGCCVGSFVNVCVARIPMGLSVLRPRSRCPRCQTAILARDNIPILGWLVLRGRCRSCKSAIPLRYLWVEAGMGLAFATVYLASAVLGPGDVWERNGAGLVLARLFVLWTAISVAVTVILMVCDVRAGSVRLARASSRRRAGLASVLARAFRLRRCDRRSTWRSRRPAASLPGGRGRYCGEFRGAEPGGTADYGAGAARDPAA